MDEKEQPLTITIPRRALMPPTQTVPMSHVVGKNPPKTNLRDHPDWSGKLITSDKWAFRAGNIDGRDTTYVLFRAWVYAEGTEPTENDVWLISCGAQNVVDRFAALTAENPTDSADGWEGVAFTAKLRAEKLGGGRLAWFLD